MKYRVRRYIGASGTIYFIGEKKYWFWPFWFEVTGALRYSIDAAKADAYRHRKYIVWKSDDKAST